MTPPLSFALFLALAAASRSGSEASVARPLVAQPARGHLLIVGGGGTTDAMLARAIELAGGKGRAKVAVFPQASSLADTGAKSAAMWLDAGAGEARVVELGDPAAARALVESATLVWFTGGDQKRLMTDLAPTELGALVRARYQDGAVVGGTSAGAAVMSRVMITGDYKEGLESDEALAVIHPGTVLTAEGLGLMPEAIVDQHFVKRRRFNRLLTTVIEHPNLVGIGIDERTAILVHGSSFEVLGESSVLVLDGRAAVRAAQISGQPLAASGIVLSLLGPGMKLDLAPPKAR